MFEAVELGRKLDKADFKAQETRLRGELIRLQSELSEAKVATLIIVAGVEGAGKGDVVNRLNKWLDSRGMETYAFWDMTDEELERPRDWRFWRRLPGRGSIAVMFGAWYWNPIHLHARGEISDAALDENMQCINEVERMLHFDGMQVIKLWFHLSHKTHKKRMKARREVTRHIRGALGADESPVRYKGFLVSAERALRHTDTGKTPWYLIESDNRWFRDMSVGQILCSCLEQRLNEHRVYDRREEVHEVIVPVEERPVTILDKLDLDVALTREEYDEQLDYYQEKLNELSWKAYDAKRSVVIVFEGWDAAGKGGTIRRLTNAIDARLYRVISIAAPTDEEMAHHYLWRFWRQVPRSGYMTMYDRSWYGRVLVERVEGLVSEHRWQRGYQEIIDFEERLTNHGTILLKFWLHIDQDEQLARFNERKEISWKQHKITDEDWRNREKWDDYRIAVNAMITHTSTGNAPWVLVPANDKYYARIEVIRTVCEQIESGLRRSV